MLQLQTLNPKDSKRMEMNLYYQRLIALGNKQCFMFEQKISKRLQYTPHPLDFKESLSSTHFFGLQTHHGQKEDIYTSNKYKIERKKLSKEVILSHSFLSNPTIEEEPNRSYIPCFSLGSKQLFKYSNVFLIQDENEEIELNFQSLETISTLTFEEFIHSITNTSLPKTTFNNKEVIKYLLRTQSIQDELQLTLLTKIVLDLTNIQTLTQWDDYLNNHKSLKLLPKTLLEALTKAGTNINPIFFSYYDFIKTYFNHKKKAI